jgi:muramoyltetrapeptide carboxypeptidase
MLKPRALAPGARLAVVAPASPFDRDDFAAGLEELRQMGFLPVHDPRVFARRGYVAGTPEERAASLNAAWGDSSIDGIIGARGGYGSAQILPYLDRGLAGRAIPFIGYSDLTAVLTFLTVTCHVVAFHGPTVAGRLGRGSEGYDRETFMRALCRREAMGEVTAPGIDVLRPGMARGLLLGGTLTQVLASLGTPFAFDPPEGHILFLDEVGERPYRLDRMVTQLVQTGLLARAGAVVFGELPRCDEPSGEPTARAVMADLFRDFPGPVLIGVPSGHTAGPALTLPLGVTCRVDAGSAPRLVIEESAVA